MSYILYIVNNIYRDYPLTSCKNYVILNIEVSIT